MSKSTSTEDAPSKLTLEVGGFYRNRKLDLVGPMSVINFARKGGEQVFVSGEVAYSSDGTVYDGVGKDERDLIAHIKRPELSEILKVMEERGVIPEEVIKEREYQEKISAWWTKQSPWLGYATRTEGGSWWLHSYEPEMINDEWMTSDTESESIEIPPDKEYYPPEIPGKPWTQQIHYRPDFEPRD